MTLTLIMRIINNLKEMPFAQPNAGIVTSRNFLLVHRNDIRTFTYITLLSERYLARIEVSQAISKPFEFWSNGKPLPNHLRTADGPKHATSCFISLPIEYNGNYYYYKIFGCHSEWEIRFMISSYLSFERVFKLSTTLGDWESFPVSELFSHCLYLYQVLVE